VEQARKHLLETVAENAAIESSGAAIAEAQARADKLVIEGESAVRLALLDSQAKDLEHEAELHILTERRTAELEYRRAMTELEIERAKRMAEIETNKLRSVIKTITVLLFLSFFLVFSFPLRN